MAPTPALPATDTATAESEAAPFPVVGVGASAGGLEALTAQRDGQAAVVTPMPDPTQSERVAQVQEDLATTRASLQSAIKELEVHNEELQAANEEAVSRNEELHHRIRTVTDLSNDLTNLLSSIQIPIVMLGIDLRIRRFTPSATKLFSLLPGDVGRPLADITSRLDVPDLGQLITSVINTLAVVERDVQDLDGQWYGLSIRPYRTQENKIDGAVLVLTNVDAIKRSEILVAAARDYTQAIVENIRHPIVVLDCALRVVSANPSFYATFDVTPIEIEKQHLFDLCSKQWNIPQLRLLLSEILPKNDVVVDQEFVIECPKLGSRIVLLNARRIEQTTQGDGGYILLAIEDVTDRRRAEMAVSDREARMNAILEAAVDAIITIDDQAIISSVNPATFRLFGYTPGELIGQNVKLLMPPPYRDEHDGYLARYAKTGIKRIIGIGREAQGQRKDGSTFPMELTISEVFVGHRWFTGIIRDISRRKELEREVLESAAEEERRIGRELHDGVGQELTGLGLLAESLVRQLGESLGTTPPLAVKLVTGLQRVHEQIRTLCRELVLAELDAEGLRAALADLSARTFEQSGVTCTFDCPVPVQVPNTTAAKHLYRIAQEALSNALRHGKPRQIRVELHSTPHGVRLSVADDGAGMVHGINGAEEMKGLGISTMRYRASLIGGSLHIGPADGGGVLITCIVPREDDNGETE